MQTMNNSRWTLLVALCIAHVCSNELSEDCASSYSVRSQLGSSALLPCVFATSELSLVSWTQTFEKELVNLTSKGRIVFLDPRRGRVKAFPNQGSLGNYSICIDELENSDFGFYYCRQGPECYKVQLDVDKGTPSQNMRLLLYIGAGALAVILLSAAGFCCSRKYISCCNKTTQDNMNNPVFAEGPSAPPMETGNGPVNNQKRGEDNLVYENDDQDPANQPGHRTDVLGPAGAGAGAGAGGMNPNLNQCNVEQMQSGRRKQRFHTELFSRLQQASFSRHYYANQDEIKRQQVHAASAQAGSAQAGSAQAGSAQAQKKTHHRGKKKDKQNSEYKNPIYNMSTDRLNRL